MQPLLKAILKPVAAQAFSFMKDEKQMKVVWDWAAEKTKMTETSWDDAALGIVKSAFPHGVKIAEDFVAELLA